MGLRVSLGFAKMTDTEMDNFTQTVINGMTGNAAFTTPPVTMALLQTDRDDFTAKISAAQTGGPMETAAKNAQRQVILGDLKQEALFVQLKSNDDLTTLLSSGFQAMSTNRAQIQLGKPENMTVKNGLSGQLVARVTPIPTTSMYEIRAKPDGGDWLDSGFSGDSQHIIIGGLTPGTNYTVQVRALGGLTGSGDWSDPITHISL